MSVYRPKYPVLDKATGKPVINPETGKPELKQSAVWWYEFIFAGKRVKESSKSTRKTVAQEAERNKRLELERALAGMPTEKREDRIRTVAEVLAAYRSAYGVNHREKSALRVKSGSAHIERILGPLLLPDLTPERIIGYMTARRKEHASNRTINIELAVLSRAMGQTWNALWPKVKKLEENHDVGRALEPEEEKALLDAAARNRSRLIYPYLITLAWTGMRADEARLLTWGQADLEAGEVIVGKAKTEAGTRRVIPMGAPLRVALEQYAAWYARALGPIQPEWYVFPRCRRIRPVDATRPVTSLKGAWEGTRTKAKVACRLHDLRHSFCTKLAEAGVPEATMLDMMGHVSTAMLRRYSHIRAKARREAIAALEARVSIGVSQVSTQVEPVRTGSTAVTH